MRNPRTEIVSIDADRLAEHAFHQMMTGRFRYTGDALVCVRAVPVEGATLLTICNIDDGEWRDKVDAPDYFWFRSERDLDRVITEMVTLEAMFWNASRVDGGVLLNVPVDRVDDVIAECLRWCSSHRLVTGDEIKANIASVKQEIQRSLVQLQQTGWMATLNKGYNALRTSPRAEGEKIPSYKTWATRQLESQILHKLVVSASLI
jgi:hypothetical protein